ncbi:MAG: hypothetical protein QXO12_01975 [Candidatus Pacearchaeota archaeon]
MVFKKKCKNCNKEIDKKFNYCPYCGTKQKEPDGLLDEIEEKIPIINFGFSGILKDFNKIANEIIRQMDEEMKKIDKRIPIENEKPKGISIKITFTNQGIPNIDIIKPEKKEIKEEKIKRIKDESLKNIEKLPREEAKYKIKRLGNVIIYEINLPGVKSLDDIEIKKLENSIEIKAIGKDKVYFKLIPINLPIYKYELKKEKLIIHFTQI